MVNSTKHFSFNIIQKGSDKSNISPNLPDSGMNVLKVFVLANAMVLETCLLFGYTDDARERWSIIMESKEIIYVIVIECCCVCVIFCRCSPIFIAVIMILSFLFSF